jgi:hypothetical protein
MIIDGRIILTTDLRETGWEGVGWLHMAQERYQWRDLVNTVMDLGVS